MNLDNITDKNGSIILTTKIFKALQPIAYQLFNKYNFIASNDQNNFSSDLYADILYVAHSNNESLESGVKLRHYFYDLFDNNNELICKNLFFIEPLLDDFLQERLLSNKEKLNADLLAAFLDDKEDLANASNILLKNRGMARSDSESDERETAIGIITSLIHDLFLFKYSII